MTDIFINPGQNATGNPMPVPITVDTETEEGRYFLGNSQTSEILGSVVEPVYPITVGKWVWSPLLTLDGVTEGNDDLFQMANLFPKTTGLPMPIWVSSRIGVQHDIRIKVNLTHGDKMRINDAASVSVRPEPRLIAGNLPPSDLALVAQWISLNRNTLVQYWEERIDTADLIQNLVRLPDAPRQRTARSGRNGE